MNIIYFPADQWWKQRCLTRGYLPDASERGFTGEREPFSFLISNKRVMRQTTCTVPFRILRKNMTRNNVLFYNFYLLGLKQFQATPTGSWCLLGALFKVSDEHPFPFYMGVPPGI